MQNLAQPSVQLRGFHVLLMLVARMMSELTPAVNRSLAVMVRIAVMVVTSVIRPLECRRVIWYNFSDPLRRKNSFCLLVTLRV